MRRLDDGKRLGGYARTASAAKVVEAATVALGSAEGVAEKRAEELGDELRKVSGAAKVAAAAQDAAAVATGRSAAANKEAEAAANRHAFAVRNAGQQVGDFFTQVSLGGGVARAFSAQAGQMGYALSDMGGKAGAVGRFLTGPWGIALTVAAAVTAPYVEKLFEGADGSDRLADRQAALAGVLDQTTGKIREQTSALATLYAARDTEAQLGKDRNAYRGARRDFARGIRQEGEDQYVAAADGQVTRLPSVVSAGGKQLLGQISQDLNNGATAVSVIQRLQKAVDAGDKSLKGALDTALKYGRAVETTANAGSKNLVFLARLAVASGTATSAQRALVAATTQGAKVDLGLADARAKLSAATTASEKAQAALDLTRRQGRAAVEAGTKTEAQYEAEVTAGERAVKAAQQAVRDAAEGKRTSARATREATKEAREEAKAAREAERANRALETSYDRLSRRLDPLTGHMRDYLAALEDIAALYDAGKITFGDVVTLNQAAADDKRAADEKAGSDRASAVFGEDGGLRDIVDGIDRVNDAAYEAAQALGGNLVDAADAVADGLGALFGNRVGSGVRNLLGSITGENAERDARLEDSLSKLAKGVGISDEAATKIGKFGGKAIEGAATGALTSSFLAPIGKALGFKTSQAGAQIGGGLAGVATSFTAVSSALGPVGTALAPIVSSVLGGVLGGAFKKAKSGAVTLTSADEAGTVSGNSAAARKAAGGLADSVQASLNAIAEQLGGDVGKFNVTVGQRNGDYRVTTGTSLKKKKGAQDFDDDAAAAQAAAVRIAITQGAILGLSDAMQKAIQSSPDIDKSLSEALKVKDLEELIGGLGSTLQKTFKDVETVAAERVRVARAYGLDLVKVEETNAKLRADTLADVLSKSLGSINSLLDDLSFGDLSEGSPVEQRNRLLEEIAKARADAEAGTEGAIDTLTNLQRRLLEVSKNTFGTAGTEYAGDRSNTIEQLERVRAIETDRAKAAQEEARRLTSAVQAGNDLASEGNDVLSEIATHASATRDAIAALAANGGAGALVADLTRKTKL